MSFLLQIFKLIAVAAIALAAYAIYKPDAVALYWPDAAPYAQMAHGYLPAAISGEKPAAAVAPAAPQRPPVSVTLGEASRKTVHVISGVSGQGVQPLLHELMKLVDRQRDTTKEAA